MSASAEASAEAASSSKAADAARDPEASPGLFARLGLAVVHPRWALTVATDRRAAGRSGSDLIAMFLLLLAATQLRGLASAAWMGSAVDASFGLRAALRILTGTLTIDLVLLVVAALALFAFAGPRRNLGRAFDLVCVAALPLVFVDLAATVVVRVFDIETVPGVLSLALSGVSFGWMGALVALSTRPARMAPQRVPSPPAPVVSQARRVGWAIVAIAVLGTVVQIIWISNHLELVKPMKSGDPAPAFTLSSIGPKGELAAPVALDASRGRVTVLDFWATWCRPCLASMPRLEQLARSRPDVTVLAINTDDPVAARALFNEHGYTMKLLSDNGEVSERYGAHAIPYTVILDRKGVIREVVRGAGHDLTSIVDSVAKAE